MTGDDAGVVTGVRPRIVDRLWFGVTLIPEILLVTPMRLLSLAVLLTFGLGWLVEGNPILTGPQRLAGGAMGTDGRDRSAQDPHDRRSRVGGR